MRVFVAPLILALLFSGDAYAQKYVLELEGFVFDRDVTEAERKLIEESIQDVPDAQRSSARTEETLTLLRAKGRELCHFKDSVLATLSEPVSRQMDTDTMCLQASFSVVDNIGDKIKIDCQLAFGYVNQRLTSDLRVPHPVTVNLGQREQIAGGGAQSGKGKRAVAIQQFLLLMVREATQDDLKLQKVPESFETKLHQKRKIPLVDGKVTLR